MAAIAKTRAANNINECAGEILAAHRSRRLAGRTGTKQSGCDSSDVAICNAIRRFAGAWRRGNASKRHQNPAAVNARGQNANLGRDHGTGVRCTRHSANVGGHNGTGVSAAGYNFGR